MNDPFVGSLTFMRVYSGTVEAGSSVLNSVKDKKERFGRMLQMHSNSREDIKTAHAGDIIAVAGLKDTTTGDTLCNSDNAVILERMEFPDPVIEVAVEPKTKADQEKMGVALQRLASEDPSFKVSVDHESGQTVMKGMGELHLEILVDRMQRVFKVDASVGVIMSVNNSLVCNLLYKYGNEHQKNTFLPKLASGKSLGSFSLSEPQSGSDASNMKTFARRESSDFVINGTKNWVTNGTSSDIVILLCLTKKNVGYKGISAFIVEKTFDGLTTGNKENKLGIRGSDTHSVMFTDVKVPKENLLPGKDGLGAPLMCLDSARYGIAWGAIGAAMDCYDSALRYSKERIQFDKPIASFQLIQKKLAEMITEITKAQLLTLRLGELRNENRASTAQISMPKRNNVEMALKIAREARQIHGGMGITNEYSIMRHMANLESVVTYEGTHDIHLLITGHDITGIPAFS